MDTLLQRSLPSLPPSLIALLVVAATACAPDVRQTATPSPDATLSVRARILTCSSESNSLSFRLAFSSNQSSEPLLLTAFAGARSLPGGQPIEATASTDPAKTSAVFVLEHLEKSQNIEEVEFESVQLLIPGSSVRNSASTLEGLISQSVRTPIGVAKVVDLHPRNESLLISVLFTPQRVGQSVLGSGAGSVTLSVGNVTHEAEAQGFTPMSDGYIQLLTFPRFSSIEGPAQLEMGEWQVLMRSLSIPLGDC